MDFGTVAKSDMSLKSRSFLHRKNDRVRKMLDKSSKDATQDSTKNSSKWWMLVSSTLQASEFMVKELLRNFTFHQKYRKGFHNETDVWHVWKVGCRTIKWDLWSEYNQLGWFFMDTFVFDWWWRSHPSFARKGLRIFKFCVISWKNFRETTIKYCLGATIGMVQRFTTIQHNRRRLKMKFEWNIFQGLTTLQLCNKVQESLSKWAKSQNNLQNGSSSCLCLTISHGDIKTMNRNAKSKRSISFLFMRKKFSARKWSFLGPGSEKKWYSKHGCRPQRECDRVAELMMVKFSRKRTPSFPYYESIFSRNTQKQKEMENYQYTSVPMGHDWNCFSHRYFW